MCLGSYYFPPIELEVLDPANLLKCFLSEANLAYICNLETDELASLFRAIGVAPKQ
jgi:hypothetical protein